MSTHNIGFYEDMTKIIFQLSSNICSSVGTALYMVAKADLLFTSFCND